MRRFKKSNPPNKSADILTLRRLLPYLWPKDNGRLRVRVIIVLVVLIAGELATLAVPVMYGRVIDRFVHPRGVAMTAFFMISAYGLTRLVAAALTNLRDSLFAPVRFRVARQAAWNSFEHMHQLSLRFHLNRRTGGVTRSIERGTEAAETLLRMVMSISPTILQAFLVMFLIGSVFNAFYVLLIALMIIAYVLFTIRFTSWRVGIRRDMNEANTQAASQAMDSLINYETVKYFGNEEHEVKRYDGAQAAYEKAALKTQYSLGLLNFGQAAIIANSLVVIMLVAGHDVQNKTITIGEFVMVNTYLLQLYNPLHFLGSVYSGIRTALVDLEQMLDLSAEPVEVKDPSQPFPLATRLSEAGPASVAFKDVKFGYDPGHEILHGVSFCANPGEKIAIVGSTGAGKSTITRLLFRFYDVNSGSILLDGHDLRDYRQRDLRAAIGVVPQDTVLFNETIGYNIAYGRFGASQQEIEKAASLAQIHDFIQSLPQGYNTYVGERGLKLSGGEKQRIAIARTILKDPRVLVLDEATSALDTHTEKTIQQALDRVSESRTTLIIAHRLSTIVDADCILVMDKGTIVERGKHAELLAKKGQYASMWSVQAVDNMKEHDNHDR